MWAKVIDRLFVQPSEDSTRSAVQSSPGPSWALPEDEAALAEERAKLLAECLDSIGPTPRSDCDAHGRVLPISDQEWRARSEKLEEVLDSFEAMPDDDPPRAHEQAMRNLDEGRRSMGMRTLFDGIY
jgi:hypothetical protein